MQKVEQYINYKIHVVSIVNITAKLGNQLKTKKCDNRVVTNVNKYLSSLSNPPPSPPHKHMRRANHFLATPKSPIIISSRMYVGHILAHCWTFSRFIPVYVKAFVLLSWQVSNDVTDLHKYIACSLVDWFRPTQAGQSEV